jgi:hypothetical protein
MLAPNAAPESAEAPDPPLSAFADWVPADYLRDYCRKVDPDERATTAFLVRALRGARRGPAVCFGTGPTLHHAFSIAPHATELVLADYLQANLDEIRRWLEHAPGAHDWTPFVELSLEAEGVAPTPAAVRDRERLVRERTSCLERADAGLTNPLGLAGRAAFPIVVSAYCADSATDDRATWERYMANIASLTAPGGRFVTAALRRCRRYRVGSRYFPSENVDALDLAEVLARHFVAASVRVEICAVPSQEDHGYDGILLACAERA